MTGALMVNASVADDSWFLAGKWLRGNWRATRYQFVQCIVGFVCLMLMVATLHYALVYPRETIMLSLPRLLLHMPRFVRHSAPLHVLRRAHRDLLRCILPLSLAAFAVMGGVSAQAADSNRVLKVGVTSGPHEEVFEEVKKVAEREYGLHIQIVSFNDYIQPDAALAAGDLDANSFQHRPFLAAQIRNRGYKLVGVGRTWIGPIGIYSKKYKTFASLPEGASIGIPNDPANESRTLLLLQKTGAIKLRNGIDPVTGINATTLDIVSNPKHFRFTEVDAAQLPRTLDDFDATTINADYAIKAGLNPVKDTILVESADGPYACLIAVREQDANQPWVQQLVKAYQSDEVRKFILDRYKGAIIPAF